MCNFNKAKTPHKKQCQAVCLNFTSRATYQYLCYEDNIYYSQNKIAKYSRASSTFKSSNMQNPSFQGYKLKQTWNNPQLLPND